MGGTSLEYAARGSAASALAWWMDAGAATLIADAPCDWLGEAKMPPRVAEAAQPRPEPRALSPAAPHPAPAAPEQADALAAARAAATPADLVAAHAGLFGPGALFLQGDPATNLLLVIEAPAPLDLAHGELLSGDAGRLLQAMLHSIGRARETVCLASLAPGPAAPASTLSMTLPLLKRLADLARPKAVVTLGTDATTALLSARSGVGRLRGKFVAFQGLEAEHALLPTFHPSMLLTAPAQKAAAWADLLTLKARLAA